MTERLGRWRRELVAAGILGAVVSCTSASLVSALGEPPASSSVAAIALGWADRRWGMVGAVEVDGDGLTLAYCCRAWAHAWYPLPALAPGRWTMDVTVDQVDCDRSTHVLLGRPPRPTSVVARALALRAAAPGFPHDVALEAERALIHHERIVRPGPARFDFELAPGDPPPIFQVVAEGGLRCCGRTRITRIDVRPASHGRLARR